MQTNRNSTRRSLLVSATALILSIAMLVGTTFAWFTDTASTGVNKIQAGNLDIEVDYSKNGSTWTSIEGTESLFSDNLWEPGHTEYVYLRVKNAGTLSLKYKVMVTPVSENGGINVYNENFKLSDYLKFGTTEPSTNNTTYADRAAARGAIGDGVAINGEGLTKESTIIANEADQYFALVVYMPENVDNHANAKPGTTAPSIDLGIKVVATQVENEKDSFDENYDADADQDNFYKGGAYYDYFAAVNVTDTADSSGNFTVTKTDSTSGVIASASGIALAGSKVNLVITKTSTPSDNFGITVNAGEELNGYDIKVTGQQENSVVQGKLFVGTGLEDFKFYHNGQLMIDGTQGSLTDGQYCYDKVDGYVYFATTTFSPFQATYKAPVAAIGTAVYGTLDDAINAASSGATITLLKDSIGKGIGSKDKNAATYRESLTIDFNGHTYTMNDPAVGSTGTESQAMHWGTSLGDVTLKNGTFKVAEGTKKVNMAMQNYINFTAENMAFDFTTIPVYKYGENQYTGANAVYNGLESPLFNNGNGGTMTLKNSTISMPESSGKGISNDGNEITIDSCTINGAVVMESANKVVKVKNSVITKGVSPYFNSGYTVKTSEKDGYSVYTNQTVVDISTTEQLNDAITNATDRNVNIAIAPGQTITLDNGIANDGTKSRDVTFVGDGSQTVDVAKNATAAEGAEHLNYQRGSTFTFENLTIENGTNTYDGIVCDELTYKNCTIKGVTTLYGKATFINCTFENTMANQYSIWTWGGTDVTFENCTFNTNGKAILLFGEEKTTKLTVNNCTFNDRNGGTAGKAAIEIGDANYGKHNNFTVVINGSTVASGFAAGQNTGSTLWANKNSMDAAHLTVTIDGTKVQ